MVLRVSGCSQIKVRMKLPGKTSIQEPRTSQMEGVHRQQLWPCNQLPWRAAVHHSSQAPDLLLPRFPFRNRGYSETRGVSRLCRGMRAVLPSCGWWSTSEDAAVRPFSNFQETSRSMVSFQQPPLQCPRHIQIGIMFLFCSNG